MVKGRGRSGGDCGSRLRGNRPCFEGLFCRKPVVLGARIAQACEVFLADLVDRHDMPVKQIFGRLDVAPQDGIDNALMLFV